EAEAERHGLTPTVPGTVHHGSRTMAQAPPGARFAGSDWVDGGSGGAELWGWLLRSELGLEGLR
ncbi:MAG: hypothetical protein AAEI08_06140, partial [Gammaproteobacteria bacterium]